MYNISFIGSMHSENGKCNPEQLYEILEKIKPEVIFDELPAQAFEFYYSESFESMTANSLLQKRKAPGVPFEIQSIKRYSQIFEVKIIPVDIDVRPELSEIQAGINQLFYILYSDQDYKQIEDEINLRTQLDGYSFLNSNAFLQLQIRKKSLVERIIDSQAEKEKLTDTYNLFNKIQIYKRENVMLQNIYDYSKDNKYYQSVFIVGAEHKRSIIEKIPKFEISSKMKLNWSFYNL